MNAYKILNLKNDPENAAVSDFAENALRTRFKESIYDKFKEAVFRYELVQDGDSVCCCISGGKDSMLLAKLFQMFRKENEIDFKLDFLIMDPGYSPLNRQMIEHNAAILSIPAKIFETDIFSSVFNVNKNPCYLCARMRRGHLYKNAGNLDCNKIALGHHFDDIIETTLMGMVYGGQIQTMMPKLHSTNFPGMELIRPLYLVNESDIIAWRDHCGLKFIQCACRFTEKASQCEEEENISKRKEIKSLIAELNERDPNVRANIFNSTENVNLDKVMLYKDNRSERYFLDGFDLPDETY
ncbi:MAG: ATPase [Ruminococcus sp.]|nr:ATPase [Ruminococcus sp.]